MRRRWRQQRQQRQRGKSISTRVSLYRSQRCPSTSAHPARVMRADQQRQGRERTMTRGAAPRAVTIRVVVLCGSRRQSTLAQADASRTGGCVAQLTGGNLSSNSHLWSHHAEVWPQGARVTPHRIICLRVVRGP
jgi:hypothetical protein